MKQVSNLSEFLIMPLRKGVMACIFNREGKILMAEPWKSPGVWQFPQGGIDSGECIETAVRRELKEELGLSKIDNVLILCALPRNITRIFEDWRNGVQALCKGMGNISLAFDGKYCGEQHSCVVVLFTGNDQDIDLSGKHDPEKCHLGHGEFKQYRWVDLNDVVGLAVFARQSVYREVVRTLNSVPPLLQARKGLNSLIRDASRLLGYPEKTKERGAGIGAVSPYQGHLVP